MPDINIIGMENKKQLCGWLVVAVLMATAATCRGGKAAETAGTVVIDTMTTAEIDSLPEEVEGAGCAYYRTPVITNGVRKSDRYHLHFGSPLCCNEVERQDAAA